MSYNIAIIGGGWYGAHLAWSLRNLGFGVRLFEQSGRLMNAASGNNQFRLHMGFHYARHHGTRQQSREGFLRFVERYPTLSNPVENNIYAIPTRDSLIDFSTYKLIMASSGIDFVELRNIPEVLTNVDGAILTPERVVMISRARAFFMERLSDIVTFGRRVEHVTDLGHAIEVDGEPFDFAIDATWGHLAPLSIECSYEPTVLLYYETRESFPAITLVDGPLSSIYPTDDPNIYTLSSVTHTPLGSFSSPGLARNAQDRVTRTTIDAKRYEMEHQIHQNVPTFLERFRFVGVQLSMKTKPLGRSDDRSCYVEKRGRLLSVLSGKIDTVFHATERILSHLGSSSTSHGTPESSELRADIQYSDGFQ